MTPTSYTWYEGGIWNDWNYGQVDKALLRKYTKDEYLPKGHIILNGIQVASLFFANEPDGKVYRYDPINGLLEIGHAGRSVEGAPA